MKNKNTSFCSLCNIPPVTSWKDVWRRPYDSQFNSRVFNLIWEAKSTFKLEYLHKFEILFYLLLNLEI